jgi:hypothetical protein
MTNEQKAQRLEEIAEHYIRIGDKDAALLFECAAMWRERGKVQWVKVAGSATRHMALYRGWLLEIDKNRGWWNWSVEAGNFCYGSDADSLQAAQAAAVAWVDEQEGRP